MKLILRIANIWPLFLALLLLDTAWKVSWQHLANTSSPILRALAGAALYQRG